MAEDEKAVGGTHMYSITGEELATRNEYLWYLLLNLQYGDMKSPPFDKHPPPGRLRPLSYVVDAETYQKVSLSLAELRKLPHWIKAKLIYN